MTGSMLRLPLVGALLPTLLTAQLSAPLRGFDAYVAEAVQHRGIPGLAIAVVKDDSVVDARGFGVRRLGDTARVTPNTIFAIGSCTRAFTAAFDTFQAKWRDPEQGSDRVTFGLNAEGSVGHLRWPGLVEFARDAAQP